jgi:hypothetical protein
MTYSSKPWRVVYDQLYGLIVTIIMIGIVAGIIVDTFGALRDKENEKNEDIKEKCFICNNEKYKLNGKNT